LAKGETSVQRDHLFDEILEDTLDHMETENAQDVGRTRDIMGEEKENDEIILRCKLKVQDSTDEQNKGTDDQSKVSLSIDLLPFSILCVKPILDGLNDAQHKTSPLVDDDLDEEEAIGEIKKKNLENNVEDETLEIDEVVNIKESRNHPLENVIGNLNQRTLRSQAQNQRNIYCFISTIEPKNVNEALRDES
ncbi:hypothetical protein Tco_0853248, partial [Tanacetum coccineum]